MPATAGGLVYRDVQGKNGYVYRQFEDGSLLILKSPRGGAGTLVNENTSAFVAISKEIGPFPTAVNPYTNKKWTQGEWAMVLNSGSAAIKNALSAGKKKMRKVDMTAPPVPLETAPASAATPMPAWVLPVAGAAGVSLLLYLMVRK